jgi:hypothetical protein
MNQIKINFNIFGHICGISLQNWNDLECDEH